MPDLFEGGRYIRQGGFGRRTIEAIHGDDVHWCDDVGPGRCSLDGFGRWLGNGVLAPDSPLPPKTVRKRSKPIMEEAIERIRNDVVALHTLMDLVITQGDKQGLMGCYLWLLQSSIHRVESAAQDLPGHIRKRVFTRIDANAGIAQSAIISLCELLKSSSASAPGESAPSLLQALSDGSKSVNRLRADLAPYLDQ